MICSGSAHLRIKLKSFQSSFLVVITAHLDLTLGYQDYTPEVFPTCLGLAICLDLTALSDTLLGLKWNFHRHHISFE